MAARLARGAGLTFLLRLRLRIDKYLMTNVLPWVPYMWSYVTRITSKNVTHYQFDQFATTPAYANISVR